MAGQRLIDGLVATPSPDNRREQWTTTGIHRVTRGDVINLTPAGPIRPVVALAVVATTDADGRDVVHVTARQVDTDEDIHESRPANSSVLARCDLRYEPATDPERGPLWDDPRG